MSPARLSLNLIVGIVALLATAASPTADAHPGAGRVLVCGLADGRFEHCAADTRGGVRLLRQLSRAACIEGRTWGHDRRGVWVSGGCRGEFQVFGPAPGHGAGGLVLCESHHNRREICPVPVRGSVVLERQLSRSACIEGRTWGWNPGGIWVAGGCRGEFRVLGRRDTHRPPYAGPVDLVVCESHRERWVHCAAPVNGRRVRVVEQYSRAACIEGRTWGVDRRGIWVTGGCRAEFSIH